MFDRREVLEVVIIVTLLELGVFNLLRIWSKHVIAANENPGSVKEKIAEWVNFSFR
jgi:hypothetical protein